MKITAFDPKKGKTILCGEFDGTRFTRIVEPKHFMKVMQGYGIQEVAFQEILEKGCKSIVIKTKTDEYYANIDMWIEMGRVADYSSGKQRFLSLKYMKLRKIRYEEVNSNTMRPVEYFIDHNNER